MLYAKYLIVNVARKGQSLTSDVIGMEGALTSNRLHSTTKVRLYPMLREIAVTKVPKVLQICLWSYISVKISHRCRQSPYSIH